MRTTVVINADGTGRILAHARLTAETKRELTEDFAACVMSLWGVLDSLIRESVDMFSVLKRQRNAGKPRFFPVADSKAGYDGLLEQSCLDGILSAQASMIYDCQPFHEASTDNPAEPYRRALRLLVDWENALDAGAQIGAWITPVEPEVRVAPPMSAGPINVAAAGELVSDFIVAEFVVSGFSGGDAVSGRAGSYVDLGFAPGFQPEDLEDTFDLRVSQVFGAVARFVQVFTSLADGVPGAKRVLDTSSSSTVHWRDATGAGSRWSPQELEELAATDLGLGVVTDSPELTFVMATAEGAFERVVPDATPLRQLERNGLAAEMAVQDAVSTWGLPDFVFSPLVERKGSGVREIGDGLIVVGDKGAIIQVKTREVEARTPEREASWVAKQIKSARDQVVGTARRVADAPAVLVNGRGRSAFIDGSQIDWVGVIIIEHPSAPAIEIEPADIGLPYVVLLRRDWEFLFSQLRSTYAVIEYLHRVGHPASILGEEPHRYFELAHADSKAEPRQLDPRLSRSTSLRSHPLLPTAPAGQGDLRAHGMVRQLLEDIATTRISEGNQEMRQRALASIDSLPVGHRTELGELLLSGLAEASKAPAGSSVWKSRTFLSEGGRDQLGFAVFSEMADYTKAMFTDWVLMRHDERREFENIDDATSIGVLVTPRSDGYREWDTTMSVVHGDPMLTDEDRRGLTEQWNRG